MTRFNSILISIAIYLIVLFLLIFSYGFYVDYPILVRLFIADLLGTILVFIFSLIFNNSSIYDPYWSVKPVVFAVYYYLLIPDGQVNIYQGISLVLIILYGLRLTLNFYRGWPGMGHEDWRYRNFRKQFPRAYWVVSFFGIHFFPSVMVYLGCLPMFVVFNEAVLIPGLAYLGLILLAFSIVLAYVADRQLWRFRKNQAGEVKSIREGLWAYSRHPNYLGEILTWWGLFFVALSSGLNFWWTGIGALLITMMFVFISIPMIEKYALLRRKDYSDYIKSTPMLLPFRKHRL